MLGAMIAAVSRVGTVADTGYRIVTVGDYDGDSRTDLLWRHATTGDVWVWLMQGATIASVHGSRPCATWDSRSSTPGEATESGDSARCPRMADIDPDILRKLVRRSVEETKAGYR